LLDLSTVSNFVFENFEQATTSGTHFHARCPLCGDSKKSTHKKRFHLDYNGGRPMWHCFNCGRSGGFMNIYCHVLGISPDEAKKLLYKYDSKRLKDRLKKPQRIIKQKRVKENFNWILADCASQERVVDMLAYDGWCRMLKDFRAEREIPDEIKLYYAYKGRYKGRIIIPIMDQDDIIYFQGRRIPGYAMEPKYKNPVAEKSLIIHNESKFGRDKYIVVTEGLIDCSMIGDQGTTMLGVEAANEFIKKLLQMTDKGVIMAYDNDEPGMKALKGFMNGSKYRKRVKYFLMPAEYKDAKDINMLQIEHKISDIYEFMVNNANDYFITSARMGVQNAYN
jgi:hypothetical protein